MSSFPGEIRLITLLALALVVPACGDPDAPVVNASGKHVHTLDVDGQSREVIVYVPALAAGATRAPVVLMFHGTSGDGEKFYNISGWREKADEVGLIAVFPTALVHCFHDDENRDGDFDDPGERQVTTKWAAGPLGDPAALPLCTPDELALLPPDKRALADHPLADDLAFTQAMLDLLAQQYSTDASRIYASGFSNGAGFSTRLAVDMSDRFAAIAAAGGGAGVLRNPTIAARPISVLTSVGEVDEKFGEPLGVPALPLGEELAALPGWAGAVVTPLLGALQLADAYDYQEGTLSGVKTIEFTYADSLVGAGNVYRVLVIEGLGHQYANGTNHPVVYADLLWDFFQGEQLP